VRFACGFSGSDDVKNAVSFLLTLYDGNELYDFAMKTFDTRCIAYVALITMREPSTYVGFVEELNRIENEHLRIALISEALGNSERALIEYSKCGSEHTEKCLYLVKRDKLFDLGLRCFERGSSEWKAVIGMKLDAISKSCQERDVKETALTALLSDDPTLVAQHCKAIVKNGLWRLAIRKVLDVHFNTIKDALIEEKQFEDAAYLCQHYLHDNEGAADLFIQAGQFEKAIEAGMNEQVVAETAYRNLSDSMKKGIQEAGLLKQRFAEIEEKQKAFPERNRKGKNRDKRGLPAIVTQLYCLLPNSEKSAQIQAIVGLLNSMGRRKEAEELIELFRSLCRAVWPIPRLPEGETMQIPPHLQHIG
jgi:hypothetical protein